MNDIKVKDVMTHLVVTFGPQDTIQEAARRLLANCISGAPVVEQDRLVGVVSESDFVSAYAPQAHSGARFVGAGPLMFLLPGIKPLAVHHTVGDVMTEKVISVSLEASVWEAASLINRYGIGRLPVVNGKGRLVGLLARADLVRTMTRTDEDVAGAVRKTIGMLGEENFLSLEVDVSDGAVTISGTADRKTTRDIVLRLASQVPGVLEVKSKLRWQWDDSDIKPVRNPLDPHEIRSDPWAIGPLVEEASS